MLQKLENFYLAILRFVVLVVAGILLIAVVLLAVRSISSFQPAPVLAAQAPHVSQAAVRKDVWSADAGTTSPSTSSDSGTAQGPNQQYFNQGVAAIAKFLDANFPGQYTFDQEKVANAVRERSNAYDTEALKSAYAKGFAENMTGLLSDPAMIQWAKANQPAAVIERIINSYTDEFNRQAKAIAETNQAQQAAYFAEKANAQQSLYAAAVGFGLFLLIVFLSIFIRIERNLRPEDRVKV